MSTLRPQNPASNTAQPQAGEHASGWKVMVRALSHRNYRLFFSGQSLSLVGTWMTRIATSWLVYRLTNSSFLLGVVGFAGQIPSLLLAPLAGVLIERWNRRRLLFVTQVLAMLQSLTLAVLTLTGVITIWSLLLLSLFQGVINAFDMPARQTFLLEMIETKKDLANAIAWNSSMVNAARLLGPSLGGVLIAAVGEGWCFFLDGVSYLAVLASLLAMRLATHESRRSKAGSIFAEMYEGWVYIATFTFIRNLLLLLALTSLIGVSYTVLMPVFATEILHGGPHTLGLLMAASGLGALLGALALSARRSIVGLGKFVPLSTGAFGAGLIAFSCSRALWLSLLLMVVTGLGLMVQMAISNTLVQTVVEENKRGRVMSFYTMAFMGPTPFGSLLAGSVAHGLGVTNTLMLSGLGCILGALWFAISLPALRREVQPIYEKIGILPVLTHSLHQVNEQRPD